MRPAVEEMLTMWPPPRARMPGKRRLRRHHRREHVEFEHASPVIGFAPSTGDNSMTPALLTRMSSRPKCVSVSATMRRFSSSRSRSAASHQRLRARLRSTRAPARRDDPAAAPRSRLSPRPRPAHAPSRRRYPTMRRSPARRVLQEVCSWLTPCEDSQSLRANSRRAIRRDGRTRADSIAGQMLSSAATQPFRRGPR